MGMFDYLVCEVPLPNGTVVEGPAWQTKDGPCELGTVRISKEGRLLFQEMSSEIVPEEKRPYYGKPEWEHGLGKMIGSLKRTVDRVVDADYHGDVRFYRSVGEWEEYVARFTNGQLQGIRAVKE